MIITTFGSVNKAYLEDVVNEDWEDIVDLLLQHNKLKKKEDGKLFNLVEFKSLNNPTVEPGRIYKYGADGMRDPSGEYSILPGTVRRCKSNVVAHWGIVLDVDEEKSIEQVAELLDGLEYVLYTTFRHTPEKNKFRVVIPFSEPLLAEDIDGRKAAIIETFPGVDNASFSDSQCFYFHSGNTKPLAYHSCGVMVNPYDFEYRAPQVYVPQETTYNKTDMDPEFADAYKKAVYESLKTCSGLHYAGKGANSGAGLLLVSICKSIDMDFQTFDNLCESISAADSQLKNAATRAAIWSGWSGNKVRKETRDKFLKEYGGMPVQMVNIPAGPVTGSMGVKLLKRQQQLLKGTK